MKVSSIHESSYSATPAIMKVCCLQCPNSDAPNVSSPLKQFQGRPQLNTVVEVSTSKNGKRGHAKCRFVAIGIFNGKKFEDIVPSSHNGDVPRVSRTDCQQIDIYEDGFDDLKMPTDDTASSHRAGNEPNHKSSPTFD